MSDSEKLRENLNKEAKENMNSWFVFFNYSQTRQNISSDKFRELEIQIASIFFGLSIIFVNDINKIPFTYVKIIFLILVLSLFFSLFCGLINNHILSKFWDNSAKKYRLIYNKWKYAYCEKKSNNEAKEFEKGIIGGLEYTKSVSWAWKLQTFFLLLSFVLIILIICIIFFL